jgi:hypothetical protein
MRGEVELLLPPPNFFCLINKIYDVIINLWNPAEHTKGALKEKMEKYFGQ